MHSAYACGKLYIAGEYAVVKPGGRAVIVAVNRGVTATVSDAQDVTVRSDFYGSKPQSVCFDASLSARVALRERDYAAAAIMVVERLRAARGVAQRGYELRLVSNLDNGTGYKIGLGSSGAVVAATVQALTDFYGLGCDRGTVLQLAIIATADISVRGSGGDIAASLYGGWIRYTSPDRAVISAAYTAGGVLAALESVGWRSMSVRQLPAPKSGSLLVGWTAKPAATEHMVATVAADQSFADTEFCEFASASDSNVEMLIEGLADGDYARISGAIARAGELLRELASKRGAEIETAQLKKLGEIAVQQGCAAKTSGAGGGDCGIAFASTHEIAQKVLELWVEAGITPLKLAVSEGCGEDFEH
ncbi:phosphomevalonate kinase [Canibacter sp. lx-72]|uniref:phosphomevalonate kinase n=1 Tax=Canibacter zhuwentaonis TaxID=2837491 RepID=UPI001BDD1D15|nr:phosphomevalonate kinase [Canibacter zhuwentaonis]MBT1018562.1 phosphomevalonate kinase [Canibacter zhuwentaonis]MBT1035757.1 phosphomevalonate kinase [Canibacter zhuwentaonis]